MLSAYVEVVNVVIVGLDFDDYALLPVLPMADYL
jgi:hypothetical protein